MNVHRLNCSRLLFLIALSPCELFRVNVATQNPHRWIVSVWNMQRLTRKFCWHGSLQNACEEVVARIIEAALPDWRRGRNGS